MKIKKRTFFSDAKEINTFSTTIAGNFDIRVEAGTNGYCGGDAGHGSVTFISLELLAGDVDIELFNNGSKLTILAGGDCELQNITEALKFIVKSLELQVADD